MSGTSLDGLDIALCSFERLNGHWKSEVVHAKTFNYNSEIKQKLANAHDFDAYNFVLFHKEFGEIIGKKVLEFMAEFQIQETVTLVASHGHTIFHQPQKKLTFQIGDGACIAAACGITSICDFRSLDVAFGGQGAPLVPIGDKLLFSEYDFCVNLGGFANISFDFHGQRLAYDICPVNIICNKLAQNLNLEYDLDGNLGRKGKIHYALLHELDSLNFYQIPAPKTLSREWLEKEFSPLVYQYDISVEDRIRTIYAHIAIQIEKATKSSTIRKILFTGGGTHNSFLMELISRSIMHDVVIPPKIMIEYKEALIFAFLGLLRYHHINNSLASVTGAARDCCGGKINLV